MNLESYDFSHESVQSRKVYEVCVKHNKPVIVMEPVKGGNLVNLPEKANDILRDLNGGSNASYALRYAASFDNIAMVLSGMSNQEQMEDNLKAMVDFKPLDDKEKEAIKKVVEVFNSLNLIQCTRCRYCIEENRCPKDILIPNIFAALNSFVAFQSWNASYYYHTVLTINHGKASDCIKCGMCERVCPQHLRIRDLLVKASDTFEKK